MYYQGKKIPNLHRNGDYFLYIYPKKFADANPGVPRRKSWNCSEQEAVEAALLLNAQIASDKVRNLIAVKKQQASEKLFFDVCQDVIDKYFPDMPWKKKYLQSRTWCAKKIQRGLGHYTLKKLDRAIMGDWLEDNTESFGSFNKHLDMLILIYKYAISKKWTDYNEAEAVIRKTSSKKHIDNKKKRMRLSMDQFKQVYDLAPDWLQLSMDLSLIYGLGVNEISMIKYEDIRDGYLFVRREKTKEQNDMAFVKFQLDQQFAHLLARSRNLKGKRDNLILSPFFVHKQFRTNTDEGKEHHTQLLPKYISREFSAIRDNLECFGRVPEGKTKATFHEIRSLSGRVYKKMGKSTDFTQKLLMHGDKKTTQIYLDQGFVDDDCYIEVQADMVLKDALALSEV